LVPARKRGIAPIRGGGAEHLADPEFRGVVALVISFTAIAPLSLSQSLAVVLGADLGSTITVQILSFRIDQYAFLFVSAGVMLFL
jgi:Na+/phosphate symporter